jgi:sulfatase modifying factor 1
MLLKLRALVPASVVAALILGMACADLGSLTAGDGPGSSEGGGSDSELDGGSSCRSSLPDGSARPGPEMLRVEFPHGSFCIDTTEVTNAQFNEYLGAGAPQTSRVPGACKNDAAAPQTVQDPSLANLPASGQELTFCYAQSYCEWAGKRLCGQLGDGGFVQNITDLNEWSYACSNGAKDTIFPYGNDFVDGACNTSSGVAHEAGAYGACHGLEAGFAALFDLPGNVAEYINNANDGGNLAAMGASFDPGYNSGGYNEGCTFAVNFNGTTQGVLTVGFRCCANE